MKSTYIYKDGDMRVFQNIINQLEDIGTQLDDELEVFVNLAQLVRTMHDIYKVLFARFLA